MKRLIAALLTPLVLVVLWSTGAKSDPPAQPETSPTTLVAQVSQAKVSPLMRMKLEKSKDILEGLALEDHEKIAAGARSLKLLSAEAGWNVIQTKEYATQSEDFRRTADLIANAAKEKDTGRATLGYVSMTVRCVECHAYIRKHRSVE